MYNKTITYWVQSKPIELFASETAYGWQAVAEIDGQYSYLGDKLVNLHTAIEAFQNFHKVILNDYEFELVIMENALKLMELEEANSIEN